MTITTRENVRKAVERALLLDPASDVQAAIAAAAQAFDITVELVLECVQEQTV